MLRRCFSSRSLTYVGSLFLLRWTVKGNYGTGTIEKGTTFLRFKIKPNSRNCFIKTPRKSPTIQISKWAWLTHTAIKSPISSAFHTAAPAPAQAACSSSSCCRGTWMVSSCSRQLGSPLVIAEAALHLGGFILMNKCYDCTKFTEVFFISPDNTHSRQFLFSSAYQCLSWVSPVQDRFQYWSRGRVFSQKGENKILSLLKYSQLHDDEASVIFS